MKEILVYHDIDYEDFESLSDHQKEVLILEFYNNLYPIVW